MMADDYLDHPTIGDVIDFLSAFPRDHKFTMMDADTCWTICKIRVVRLDDGVEFYGEYGDMIR